MRCDEVHPIFDRFRSVGNVSSGFKVYFWSDAMSFLSPDRMISVQNEDVCGPNRVAIRLID